MFGLGLRHKFTNQADLITQVRSGDGQVYEGSDYLLEPFRVASYSGVGAKFDIHVQRSRDGFALRHTELEEHSQNIVSLVYQYDFMDADHSDPKEVMKAPQVFHVE